MKLLLQDYNPEWNNHFQSIKKVLHNTLGAIVINIEHIGSTSVPGLAAKPIIDIDMVYHSEREFEAIKERLSHIGYFHNGDQGIPKREAFKRKCSSGKHPVLDEINHHLYACPSDSEELQRHLLFRDFLRKNSEAKHHYQALKFEIA